MAYTKYSLTPANNNAAPPNGAPEGMLPSAVNDTMRDMMAEIRDCGDGIRTGVYALTAPVITGGSINGTTVGASTASTGRFSTLEYSGTLTGGTGVVNLGSGQFVKDASGNVGIGTSSPTVGFRLHAVNAGGANVIASTSSDASGVTTYMQANGSVSGVFGTLTNHPQVFLTNNAERMRIDSSGNLLVGTTATNPRDFTSGGGVALKPTGAYEFATSDSNLMFLNSTTSASGSANFMVFRQHGVDRGSIATNGTITIYNTTSDYRLKTVISPVSDSGTRLDAIQPIEYDWKAGGRTRGFLAHQFAEVYPNSVTGEKDAVDKEGKPVYQGMQAATSEVIADLIAEIQSLRKRVAQLESK